MPAPGIVLRVAIALLGMAILAACSSPASPQNTAPVADAGPDRAVVVGQGTTLDASASSDADGDELAFSWAITDRPAVSAAAPDDPDAQTTTFTPDVEGTYQVTVTVSDGSASDTDSLLLTVHPAGVERLEGDPASPAADAVFDLHVPLELDLNAVEFDPARDADVLRTELEIEFHPEATIGEVNDLLQQSGGKIVSMVAPVPTIVVSIPDPGSVEALEDLATTLEQAAGVVGVALCTIVETPLVQEHPASVETGIHELPGNIDPTIAADMNQTDHHLAIRLHAAWNVRAALPAVRDRPFLVLADSFGDGEPDDDFSLQAAAADFGSGNRDRHGYHVLGIIVGAYGAGPGSSARQAVTGGFPGMMMLRVVDNRAFSYTPQRQRNRLVQRLKDIVAGDPDARVVVNTSQNHRGVNRSNDMNPGARTYTNQIRGNDLESRVVHLTSAGNVNPSASPQSWPAADNSFYTFAALGDLRGRLGGDIDNLSNVLVIENRVNSGQTSLQRPVPACASGGSIMGGHLSAIGTSVWSFDRARSPATGGAINLSGTSMATPQVAALAAYAWSLDPTMDAQGVIDLLLRTSRDDFNTSGSGCNSVAPMPVVDALDAVLAAGGDLARTALLDVADGLGAAGSNGAFDEHDITLLLSSWTDPAVLDYSRFDLNGDGVTDGTLSSSFTERMDLDRDSSFGTIVADYLGADVAVDETAVTDLDVLCHVAYSNAYTGNTFSRNQRLGQLCGIVDVTILDPSDGDQFKEGEIIGLQVDVNVGGRHEGDVVVYSRGREQYRLGGYSYLDEPTITFLSTREVCPEDPTVEVAFEDDRTGLRASDRVELDIVPNELSVSIAGPNPRWVRVKTNGPDGDPFIEDIGLAGRGSVPTCNDPFSERVDQAGLTWIELPGATVLDSGPEITLPGSYLGDGAGGFVARDVELRFTHEGVTERDELTLRPCSSSLGLEAGEAAVEGYPECPLDAVIGSIIESLASVFGTIDPSDAEDIVAREIHGIPHFRDVLEALGTDPCDPRFCDPYPPTFPWSEAELREGFYGDRGLTTTDLLDRLFKVLDPPTLDEYESQMLVWLQAVGEERSISDADRELLAAAGSVALGAVQTFLPTSWGGEDAWRNLGFAGDPATLADRVDVLAPARRALEGFLTAVVVDNQRSAFTSELYSNAAAYAAALAALEQAQSAPVE